MTATTDPPNDIALVVAMLDDPTALNSELTHWLGLPDVPDDDGDAAPAG